MFVALENGEIYDLHQQRLVFKADNVVHEFFLKAIDENILITSSAKEKTYVANMSDKQQKQEFPVLTKFCAMIMDTYLLIVNNFGAALVSSSV